MRNIVYMTLTVLLALLGSTMLKLSDGFANLIPTLIFLVSECCAFYFFAQALRTLPLSVGYAIWGGCSTAANALVGHFYFQEALGLPKIAALVVIIIGIVLINHARVHEDAVHYYNRSNYIIR